MVRGVERVLQSTDSSYVRAQLLTQALTDGLDSHVLARGTPDACYRRRTVIVLEREKQRGVLPSVAALCLPPRVGQLATPWHLSKTVWAAQPCSRQAHQTCLWSDPLWKLTRRAQVYEVLKPVLLEKEKAEAHLVSNKDKIEFVIVRPGGLKSEPATGRGVLTTDTSICGSITRGDVADLVRAMPAVLPYCNLVVPCRSSSNMDPRALFEST